MDNQLYCPLCEDEYRDDNLPRLLINCGHSFCEKCLKKIMSEGKGCFKIVCPEDGQMVTLKDSNLSNIPKNIALMKIIESKKGNSSFKDLEMSKITRNEEFANEDDEAQDLVDAIKSTCHVDSEQKIPIDKEQSTKIEIAEHEKSEKQNEAPQICKQHKKPLQVVCIFDMKKICVNCAIFGEHKGHEFKSLEEIEKERMDYYTSIIEIMDKKETINSRISNQETCSSIMELLSNKKNKMKTAILEKYKKLADQIEAKQKQSLRSLDTLMQKTETKVKSLMKIDPNIMQKYDNWEYKSYEEIKILEGQNFEAKLKLLFNEPASVDVIQEGDQIVQSMNKQQENMFNEVELSLENLGVEFNLQIFNHIEGFVEVLEQPKRKKSKARTTAVTKVEVQSTKSFVSPVISTTSLGKSGFFSPIKDQITTQYPLEARSLTEEIRITPEKEKKQFQVHEEDLLDVEFDSIVEKEPLFVKSEEFNIESTSSQFSPQQSFAREDKNVGSPPNKNFQKMKTTLERQKSPKSFEKAKKDDSFAEDKIERPNKKKLLKIKVPQKFEKIMEGLANDQLDAMDLTNAQLGDASIIAISEFLNGSKVRAVKLIRNKLTDDSIVKILPYLRGVITLNLSQNLLTQRVLDILLEGRPYLSSMRSIILSQNKIMERKAKAKIQKLKAMDLLISI